MSPPPPATVEALAGAVEAQGRLADTLAAVDDAAVGRPSLLPGWTVGHVLTHIARNADSHVVALEGGARGVVVDRYPGGPDQRNGEIEAGADRPAAELVADVLAASDRLATLWSELPDDVWERPGTSMGRSEPLASLPFRRWREVEIHHVDLGLAYGPADWPSSYVGLELRNAAMAWRAARPMGLTELPPAALALPPHERLAWLVGRLEIDGLPPVPQWF